MSREYNLYSNLVKVEAGNRVSLLQTLKDLSDFDCDFNGENGADYANEETLREMLSKWFTDKAMYILHKN